jgi:formylglycine-generating enzyme required for sulfatase activity
MRGKKLAIGLFIFLPLALYTASVQAGRVLTVKVDVSANGPFEKELRSYLSKELMSIDDIMLYYHNEKTDWRLNVLGLPVQADEQEHGVALSVVIYSSREDIVGHWLKLYPDLRTGCSSVIASFKTLYLDKARKTLVRNSAEKGVTEEVEVGVNTLPPLISNSIGMKFVAVPAGAYMMGSPERETGRDNDEGQHRVRIRKPFYLQATEVTQGQWKRVMGSNPAEFKNCGDDCPVENVSWNEAQEFVEQLNDLEQTSNYRLPTEAEWEYACRAGTTTEFNTGGCIYTDQANYNGEYPIHGCLRDEHRKKTVRVGSFRPNLWGLYDMHGNVWEWCQDWYGAYPGDRVVDPKGPSTGKERVLRGGSWTSHGQYVRSANRNEEPPGYRRSNSGFRVAKDS